MAESRPLTSLDNTQEELELEAELQAMTERKKTVFLATREADERLRRIREKEEQKRQRLREIRAERVETDMRKRYALRLDAENRNNSKQETGLQEEIEAVRLENDRLIEKLEAVRRKYSERGKSLERLKVDLQRTTWYSRTQQKEKREREKEVEEIRISVRRLGEENAEQADEIRRLSATVKCLRDEVSGSELPRSDDDKLRCRASRRDVESQTELELQRTDNEIDSAVPWHHHKSLVELKEKLEHITTLSNVQQRTIERLEERLSAGQQVTVETQLRQLDEMVSLSDENKQLKQTLTVLHQQQQQTTSLHGNPPHTGASNHDDVCPSVCLSVTNHPPF